MDAIFVLLVFEIGTANMNLEYRRVIVNANWLPFIIFGTGPRMSLAKNSNRPLAGKRFKLFVCVFFARFRAHLRQAVPVVRKMLATNNKPVCLLLLDVAVGEYSQLGDHRHRCPESMFLDIWSSRHWRPNWCL